MVGDIDDSMRPSVLVFTPTYNDHITVVDIARRVAELGNDYRLLIIDDGSSTAVGSETLARAVLHFRMPDNFGLGACSHVAFDHALKHGYRVVVRIDGDGQHSVEDIPRLLRSLDEADVVVGGRLNHDQGKGLARWVRRTIKGYLRQVASLVTGGRAPHDVNTGFMATNRQAIEKLNTFSLDRFPEPQIFILACREGLRVSEVFIEQRPRQYGHSSLNLGQALRLFYRFNVFVLNELLRSRQL